MPDWTHIDLSSLVLGALLGAFASTWYGYFVRRPKLRVTGGGGGGGAGPGFHVNHLTVSISPGLLGLKLPETTILGWRIHGTIEHGMVVERSPAHECRANLYDKETGQFVKPLWWRRTDGTFAQHVTLQSGESASLMLFARRHDEPLKYFVFQPASQHPKEALVPSEHEMFDATRHFRIEITHSYGKKKMKLECAVIRGFDGRLQYQHQRGGGSF